MLLVIGGLIFPPSFIYADDDDDDIDVDEVSPPDDDDDDDDDTDLEDDDDDAPRFKEEPTALREKKKYQNPYVVDLAPRKQEPPLSPKESN